jgi:glucose-6-phosphate 1-dehydrogenase
LLWRFESVLKVETSGQATSTPFDMLLFGATGDLALRKLVPALYRRHLAGQIVAGSRVLAVARTSQTREVYLAQIEETCRKYLRAEEFSAERWMSFAALVDYITVDATQAQDFKKLRRCWLDAKTSSESFSCRRRPVFLR